MEQPLLLLRILEGPHKGTRVNVREGLTIGRKEGDLVLKDAKMSIRHAQIMWRDNEWVLVDLGSSNKIKVDERRYGEVVLYAGLNFTIGSTAFEILEKPKADRVKNEEADTSGSAEIIVESLTWREILSSVLSRAAIPADQLARASDTPAIRPFPTMVRLEFISGVQHGTVWHLGYGPREAGAGSFDLPLYDDAAADSCFLLDTAEGKVLFRAIANESSGAVVRLNGNIAAATPVELRSGDRIEFGKTRIRVLVD